MSTRGNGHTRVARERHVTRSCINYLTVPHHFTVLIGILLKRQGILRVTFPAGTFSPD